MTDEHNASCPFKAYNHSDAAKRLRDTYSLHRVADPHGSIGKWFAVRLEDGTYDGTLYDSKRDCVAHQHHNEQYYCFVAISPANMTACEAEILLGVARRMYEAGFRLADPSHRRGGLDVIKRATVEDQLALLKGVGTNLRFPRKGR